MKTNSTLKGNANSFLTHTKNDRGITLVALVVTIIVLIILAGVSISLILGENGIITKSKYAKQATLNAQLEEQEQLNEAVSYLENMGSEDKKTEDNNNEGNKPEEDNLPTEWTQSEKDEEGNINITKGTTTLQVGDYINYSPTDEAEEVTITENYSEFTSKYTGKWRIFGVNDERKIMIVPETAILTTSDYGFQISGQSGYKNGIDQLDRISAIFGNGYGATGEARSIRVEDINKITGYNPKNEGKYDPNQIGNGTRYGAEYLNEYGNKVTYYWDGTDVPYYTYTRTDGTAGTPNSLQYSHTSFSWFDNNNKEWKSSTKSTTATTENKEEIVTVESDYYSYYINSLSSKNQEGEGLKSNTKAYNTIYGDSNNDGSYWLASNCIDISLGSVEYEMRSVRGNKIYGGVMCWASGNSNPSGGPQESCAFGVKPIVFLKSDIKLTGNSTDGWTIVKE